MDRTELESEITKFLRHNGECSYIALASEIWTAFHVTHTLIGEAVANLVAGDEIMVNHTNGNMTLVAREHL